MSTGLKVACPDVPSIFPRSEYINSVTPLMVVIDALSVTPLTRYAVAKLTFKEAFPSASFVIVTVPAFAEVPPETFNSG